MQETYNIKIDQFEGPFDLLLFFIQRDELDIYDIPIARITDDFLNYIFTLEELNINVASEFILMASTLIRIKARMLLPRKEVDESGNVLDPRSDLINQIIEYRKIKSILKDLEVLEDNRSKIHMRGNKSTELKILSDFYKNEEELEPVSLYKLFTVFKNLLKKQEEQTKRVHTVRANRYKIEDEKLKILSQFSVIKRVGFKDLFIVSENRLHAVVVFLAMLELLTSGDIKLVLGIGKNNFWIEKK
ncbi:MAG: segregation/condensation protein A [Saprospiraceae bacterium]|nr:segregation/condensation protein A [Saprospiraceae bacterium]